MQKKNENSKTYVQNALDSSSDKILYRVIRESLLYYEENNSNYAILSTRVKRINNDETLVEATVKNQYSYWLSQEDIAEIARLEYNNYHRESDATFEVLGSMPQLYITLELFQLKIQASKLASARLTLIINLANLHWVTLVIAYKNNQYVGYYSDSKDNPIPPEYYQLLLNAFQISSLSLSPGFIQQKDEFNCGLWALENAADLNQMIDQNQSILWIINKLKRPRSKEYFNTRREYFAEKLRADPAWNERHPLLSQGLTVQEALQTKTEPDPKRFKSFNDKKGKITILLETFVETFMSVFVKKLGVYHLLAKGESLTEESLKIELKTGLTGALLGIGISQSLMGSIPSLVTSLRMISGKFYPSKDTAQKITKIFSAIQSEHLDSILSEAAVDIFHSFESQFMQVTDKAGDKVAMEKLAEDAIGRLFNAIKKYSNLDKIISKELIEKSVLQGPSEKFFDPNVKRARLRISGYTIQDNNGKAINTANLYEKTSLVALDKKDQPHKFYTLKNLHDRPYGYRRLFEWEKKDNGELKENLKPSYTEQQFLQTKDIFQFLSRRYYYLLHAETNQAEARRILDKIKNRYLPQILNREPFSKKPIFFDLRKPIENFSGRIEVLKTLHRTLMSERTTAIVPNWATLSISSAENTLSTLNSDSTSASSGSQLSINGLGGIGKTQLALRYAELYASDYDYNILWISAETKENIAYSLNKLATRLHIATKDCYNQRKSLEEIVEEIYEYFSDRKSLFIFDNVENYRAIEAYLPKSMLGNKPTLLITSRYRNWENVAPTLSLNIFTEQETEELIKKSLNLGEDIPHERIKELHQLLQGLPLALQQALAYIKLRRNTDTSFSFHHYIELYKEKTKELLNFNFVNYSNDPYLETVFTTWLITLCKIKTDPIGDDAIEILNIMAYLDPDNIASKKFYHLNAINRRSNLYDLDTIMHLLSSYSMINPKEQKSKYTIHRLVQQVIRINLEQNQPKFKEIVEKTQLLLWHWHFAFKKDEESVFHYLHFLLYMSEHKDLIPSLLYGHPEKAFFDNLALQNLKYCHYFIDLAYFKFSTKKFLTFLGDAVAYFIKLGLTFHLSEILNYIEKKWTIGSLSKENIKYILEHFKNVRDPVFKIKRYSTAPSKKIRQQEAVRLFYEFRLKIFDNQFIDYDSCSSHSRKRNICSLSETEQERIKELRKQPIKAHFKKIEQISRYISSALMTKDTLSALLQGHFDEVAINFGLMTSSLFFGKISDSLLTQGKNLASDASLLEKNLGLENKKVLSILFNENVSSMGKRQFLGKALQAASPFVAKATSIYFAYNLKNEIHAYRMGNKDVLPNIISNSVILSIDGIEAGIEGAEFLGFITGISAFTGPLGEGMALVVWLGAEGYSAEKQVEAIEKYVHLSRGEKIFEFLLSTLHLAPLEYIQLKANNGQLVERAINFLKDNTAIQWYIFPAFTFVEDTCKIRKAFLKEKINFTPDDNNPDKPAEGDLFCLSAAPPPYEVLNIKMKYYLCHKTLGISYALNRTGNGTLVDLGEGEDEVIAFSHSPTLFIVQNGKKWYKGGDNGTIFDLQGNSIAGLLQGGNETDILVLDKFHPENSDYVLLDADGFLCGKNKNSMQSIPPFCSPNEMSIQIDRIDHIYGRRNEPDILYVNKDVRFIDGYGGKNQTHPDNFFITDRSDKNLKFVLRNNTLITFLSNPTTDSIEYRIPSGEIGEAWIYYHFKKTLQHQFFFEYPLEHLETMTVKNNTLHISVLTSENTDRKLFAITISNRITSNSNQTKNATSLSKNIAYFFQGIVIKLIQNEHLYGQEITSNNKTVDEKISLFRAIANRLEKTFSIQLINNLTLSIGREKKHELFYINGLHESHLVGNGGENVYIILPRKNAKFPLPKVILYDTSERDSNDLIELIDTLDLREMIKEYKQIYPKAVIASHVVPSANDLILTLSNSVYSPIYSNSYESNCFEPWLTIQLKNALLDNSNWYQKLDIVLDSVSRNIVPLEDDVWTLTAAPLIFTDDKKIILLTNQDIEEDTEIQILKNIGNYAFFRDETNLILTNAFEVSNDYCTIICRHFYQEPEMRKKILSTTFKFFDQEIHPNDHQKQIEHATHFQHLTQIITTSNLSSLLTHTYLNSIGMKGHQKKLSQPRVRRKRQAHQEEKIIVDAIQSSTSTKKNSKQTNQTFFHDRKHASQASRIEEENRILAMADDYLKKYDDSEMKAYRGKKNINQTKDKKKKTNSPLSVQKEKDKFLIEKNDSVQNKNKGNFHKRTMPNYSAQNNLKALTKPIKNQFRAPNFFKPEVAKLKKTFFNVSNSNKKINFLVTPQLTHQENFKPTTKAISLSPYQQNESRAKKPNQYVLSLPIEPPNLHSTLMLFDLIARKSLKNPVVPSSSNKKLNKTILKVEKQQKIINSKTFGFQKL